MMNQKGSTVLLIIPMTIAIGLAANSFLMWFNSNIKLQARNNAIENSANVSTSLKMLYVSREACNQNLVTNGFGQTLAGLSSNNNVRLMIPTAGGTASGVLMAAGASYEGLKIEQIRFSVPRSIYGIEPSYISDLSVSYTDPMTKNPRTFSMPFYFTTNPAGQLTACMLTSYLPAKVGLAPGQYPPTMDDLICTQVTGSSDFIYSPYSKTCVRKSQMVTSN